MEVRVTSDTAYPLMSSFDDLGLKDGLLRGIRTNVKEKPDPISQHAIKPIMEGRDTIIEVDHNNMVTQSDMDAALIIGALQRIDASNLSCQTLIVVGTVEAARHAKGDVSRISEYMNVRSLFIDPKDRVRDNIDTIKCGARVVIGTPIRVYDYIVKSYLRLDDLLTILFLQVDDIFSRGFKDQMDDIMSKCSKKVQVCLSFDMMTMDLAAFITKHMSDPARVFCRQEPPLTLNGIRQYHVEIERDDDKLAMLDDFFNGNAIPKTILYVNAPDMVDKLVEEMLRLGLTVSALRADMDHDNIELLLREFREAPTAGAVGRVLVSTGLLARGIDWCWPNGQASLVLNYDLPRTTENYFLRVGGHIDCVRDRGVAISFVTPTDMRRLQEIEKRLCIKIDDMPWEIQFV